MDADRTLAMGSRIAGAGTICALAAWFAGGQVVANRAPCGNDCFGAGVTHFVYGVLAVVLGALLATGCVARRPREIAPVLAALLLVGTLVAVAAWDLLPRDASRQSMTIIGGAVGVGLAAIWLAMKPRPASLVLLSLAIASAIGHEVR